MPVDCRVNYANISLPISILPSFLHIFNWEFHIFLVQASRHDEAEQLFRQAQMLAPSDPSVYMMTGIQITPHYRCLRN